MKISWQWLLELCDLDRTPTVEEGAEALTSLGLEVEAMVTLGEAFSGVVVAEVVGKKPHPGSDKLNLVDVIIERGGAATQVVCGAPNVPTIGGRVLWARPGAKLPGGITLATKPVKGIDSPGMLCSEIELGVGDDDDGIVVLEANDKTPLGSDAQLALGADDWMLDIGAPANRPDLLGHIGVARELVARIGGRLRPHHDQLASITTNDIDLASRIHVAIEDTDGCSRYVARLITGLTVGKSPRKFAQRLRTVGVRPVSNIVDVTNYVMFEYGQPLHSFDAAHVPNGRIIVRTARDGETVKTLDGTARALIPGDIAIAGEHGILAVAGVMGGADSEVRATTTDVLLEAATFSPMRVRRTARRLALNSESAHRFERGVDPAIADLASQRAAALLVQLAGGHVVAGSIDTNPKPKAPASVKLRRARLESLTGVAFTTAAATDSLKRLGFIVGDAGNGDMNVTPPSARADVMREADVIEEVLRIAGFDQVPATIPTLRAAPTRLVENTSELARDALAAAGIDEAITYAFHSDARLAALKLSAGDRRQNPLALKNPMTAEQNILRTSLLPNLLAAVARNQSYGHRDVALFEVGSIFLRRGGSPTDVDTRDLADEPVMVAGVLTGTRSRYLNDVRAWDFFDAKALVERLIEAIGGAQLDAAFLPSAAITYLHPGIAARVHSGDSHDDDTGVVGEIHPDTRLAFGIDAPVFAFEIDLAKIPRIGARQMRAIPRFPAASRDVSLLMNTGIPAQRVRDVVTSMTGEIEGLRIEELTLLEDYRGDKVAAGQKSMLWSLRYRSLERTLTDVEVDGAHERIVARLVTDLPAQRR